MCAAVAGPVNALLSWKLFHPLARLTYSIYLIHLLFIRITTERSISVSYDDDLEKVSKIVNF
jgi:peptidoglycan/LPS O-acetylase OafA/YrhL